EGSATSASMILPNVGLVGPPADDLRGPVIARYRGGAVHAGEIAREIGDFGVTSTAALRENPALLESSARHPLNVAVLQQAALDEQLFSDSDLVAKVYDYQRELLAEKFAASRGGVKSRITSATLTEALKSAYCGEIDYNALNAMPDYIQRRSAL